MFRKKTIALLLCSLLPVVSSGAELVVTPNSPDIQYGDKVDSLNFDSIKFETNGQDFEKSLGVDKSIGTLTVTNGLLLDWAHGGGKTKLNISAKEMHFGGINFGGVWQDAMTPIGPQGSTLTLDTDILNSKSSQSALSTKFGTSVYVNATQGVHLESANSFSLNAGEDSLIDIQADNINIISHTTSNSTAVVKSNSEGVINLDSKRNITITSHSDNSGYGIHVDGQGKAILTAVGDIAIKGNDKQRGIYLHQARNTNSPTVGTISLNAENIYVTGNIHCDLDDVTEQNGLFLKADGGVIKVSANTDSFSESKGAIEGTEKAKIVAESDKLIVNNNGSNDNSAGIYLDKGSIFEWGGYPLKYLQKRGYMSIQGIHR